MARIDKFIDALFQFGADELRIVAGMRAILVTGQEARPVTHQDATSAQVVELLREIAPEVHHPELEVDGAFSFEHRSGQGKVKVTVGRVGDQITASLRPVPEEPDGESALEALRAWTQEESVGEVELDAPDTGVFIPEAGISLAEAPDAIELDDVPETGAGFPDLLEREREPVPDVAAGATRAPDSEYPAPPEAPPSAPVAVSSPGGAAEIDAFFRRMQDEGCSDLHLTSGQPPLFRLDGSMVSLMGDGRLSAETVHRLVLEITPEKNRREFEELHDTDFAYEIPGLARFRANLFMDRNGPGAVFRIIPAEILSAKQLGLPPAVMNLCELRKGLVLVTGPTGSGKSTTLAAMIDHINRSRDEHIITIEDPIEFVHPQHKCLINQREVGVHTKGFKQALRAALREDPDIVLVGEMRDLETVAIAIETAETGHLVFGTLHTNTAASTIDRIIDQFPADRQAQIRTMLSESLKGVIAQTLCKKVGGGRVAALEVLIVTASVANLIREGKTFQIPSIMQTGRSAGMTTLNESLLRLLKSRLISPEEAVTKSVARAEMRQTLMEKGIVVRE
ncbi:MAG: type IV pilus twitching motility protein PilT [Deltaproteobacteria bacterium]|nr:type IV pilus twitching motility protein PilT [Deltaproteobacteria bacterium]